MLDTTLADVEAVQDVVDRLTHGIAAKVAATIKARDGDASLALIDIMVRDELIAVGEAVDGKALAQHLAESDEGLSEQIENCGRNREYNYIWARMFGAVREANGLIPVGRWLRRVDDDGAAGRFRP